MRRDGKGISRTKQAATLQKMTNVAKEQILHNDLNQYERAGLAQVIAIFSSFLYECGAVRADERGNVALKDVDGSLELF